MRSARTPHSGRRASRANARVGAAAFGLASALMAAGLPRAVAAQERLVPRQAVILQIASCVWTEAPGLSRDVLASEPGSPMERSAIRRVFDGSSCIRRHTISGQSQDFRSALAEAGVLRDESRRARLHALAPVPASAVGDGADEAFIGRYTHCIAAADPVAALAVLEAPVGSAEERSAIRAVGGAMMACTPPTVALRINPTQVRGGIAVALYQLSEGEQ